MKETAPPPLSRPPSIPEGGAVYLDGVRAIAANLVVVSHVNLLFLNNAYSFKGGSIAVVIFFLLSGFLITWTARAKTPDTAGLARFTADRIARIATPYVPVLLMVAMLNAAAISGTYGEPGQNHGWMALVGNLFFLQDYPAFQALEIAGVELPWRIRPYQAAEPFWTVAVEFWIYLAFGLFYFVLIMGARARSSAVLLMTASSVPVIFWHLGGGAGKCLSLVWCLGSVAAIVVQAAVQRLSLSALRRLGGLCALLSLVAMGARIKKYGFQDYDFQIACLMGIALFGGLLLLWNPSSKSTLPGSIIKFFASYSYSLYLIHNVVIVLFLEHAWLPTQAANIAGAVVVSHLASIAVYYAVERHHKRVSNWLSPRLTALLAPAKPKML